jgi:hypothetical protein
MPLYECCYGERIRGSARRKTLCIDPSDAARWGHTARQVSADFEAKAGMTVFVVAEHEGEHCCQTADCCTYWLHEAFQTDEEAQAAGRKIAGKGFTVLAFVVQEK